MSEGIVTTEADRILEFIQGKKEVSVSDIAKEINMSSDVVETLCSLLEEENLLIIKYKFTTPYIVPVENKKEELKEKSDKEHLEGGKKDVIKKFAIHNEPTEKNSLLQEDKKEQNIEIIEENIKEDSTISETSKEASEEATEKNTEKDQINKEKKDFEIPQTQNIHTTPSELMSQAREAIATKNFKKAELIISKIEQYHIKLPEMYAKEDSTIRNALAAMKEHIVVQMNTFLDSKFEEDEKEFLILLDKGTQIMNLGINDSNELSQLEQLYSKLKELYFALPSGYAVRKSKLQNQLLKFYKDVLHNKKSFLMNSFSSGEQKVRTLLQQCLNQLQQEKVSIAQDIFDGITAEYSQLPEGFLDKKTTLQHDILNVYQDLLDKRQKSTKKKSEETISVVSQLLKEAKEAVNIDNITHANLLTKKIATAIAKIPKTQASKRIEAEELLLELHRVIELKKNKKMYDSVVEQARKVQKMISEADRFLSMGDDDSAREHYAKAVISYNKLPHSFSMINKELQKNILDVYKELLLKKHKPQKALDKKSYEAHQKILGLILKIHGHIQKREYGGIKDNYKEVYKLYHDLPETLGKEKKLLYDDIHKIYEELALWSELERGKILFEEGKHDGVMESIVKIKKDYEKLIKKHPEDMELLRYIYEQYLLLSQSLNQLATTGQQVTKNINSVKQETIGTVDDVDDVDTVDTTSTVGNTDTVKIVKT